ncbi:MAG TPA: ATP-binding protein [Burkholderiales bacterium]
MGKPEDLGGNAATGGAAVPQGHVPGGHAGANAAARAVQPGAAPPLADETAPAAAVFDPLAPGPLLSAEPAPRPPALRRMLVAMVIAALLPMGLFAAFLFYYLWQSQQALRDQEQLARVRTMAALVQSELNSSIRRLELLSKSPLLSDATLPAFYRQVQQTLPDNPDWTNILLISRESQLFNALLPYGENLPRLGDQAYQRDAFNTGKPTVSDLFLARSRPVMTVDIAVPVTRNGRVAYLLIAGLKPDRMAEMLRHMSSDESIGAIYDRNLRYIARTRDQATYFSQLPTPVLEGRMRGGHEGVARGISKEGTATFTAWAPLANGWWVALGTPVEASDRALTQYIALLGSVWLLMILVGLIMARILWKRIDESLAATGEAAVRRAAGEMAPFPQSTFAELASLSQVIDRLFTRERAARAQAEAANQAKDEFLAMLGHELRNPIGAISNAVHILDFEERRAGSGAGAAARQEPQAGRVEGDLRRFTLRGEGAGDERRGDAPSQEAYRAAPPAHGAHRAATPDGGRRLALGVITRQSAVLKRMIDDLLDLGRVLTGKVTLELKPMDLAQSVRNAVEGMNAAGRMGEHQLDVDTEPAWISGDPARIEQILTNLVLNAVNHTPPGGGIRVFLMRAPARARLSPTGAPEMAAYGDAVIVVADDGIGIAPETLPRVFDMFFQERQQVDRPKSGLGIGLTLVQRLTEMHNGEVTAESAGLGQGARFTVRLPAIAPPVQGGAPAPVPQAAMRRVLLIEDNPDGRETLQAALQIEGHMIETAADGPTGIELLKTFHADAAIVDVGLPGMDGYEVAREIRAAHTLGLNGKPILLIALTGYGLAEDQRRAREAGFNAHLVKPADFKALAVLLQEGAA